jgi:hypothetical protein
MDRTQAKEYYSERLDAEKNLMKDVLNMLDVSVNEGFKHKDYLMLWMAFQAYEKVHIGEDPLADIPVTYIKLRQYLY